MLDDFPCRRTPQLIHAIMDLTNSEMKLSNLIFGQKKVIYA